MKSILLFLLFGFTLANQIGSMSGEIIDKDTHQPLIGANVIITGTELGAASNTEGKFAIFYIPVGSYTISVSMIGYESVSRANVNIYGLGTDNSIFSLFKKTSSYCYNFSF